MGDWITKDKPQERATHTIKASKYKTIYLKEYHFAFLSLAKRLIYRSKASPSGIYIATRRSDIVALPPASKVPFTPKMAVERIAIGFFLLKTAPSPTLMHKPAKIIAKARKQARPIAMRFPREKNG